MSDSLQQKLSEANWTNVKEMYSGFDESETLVFKNLLNDIVETKTTNPFYTLQDELRFYELEEKQYLLHTRKKFSQ